MLNLSSIPIAYRPRVLALAERARVSAVQAALRDDTDVSCDAADAVRAVVARFERVAEKATAAAAFSRESSLILDLHETDAQERATDAAAAVWERAFAQAEGTDGYPASVAEVAPEEPPRIAPRGVRHAAVLKYDGRIRAEQTAAPDLSGIARAGYEAATVLVGATRTGATAEQVAADLVREMRAIGLEDPAVRPDYERRRFDEVLAPDLSGVAWQHRAATVVRAVPIDDLVRAGLQADEPVVTFEELEADHEIDSLRAAHERSRDVILRALAASPPALADDAERAVKDAMRAHLDKARAARPAPLTEAEALRWADIAHTQIVLSLARKPTIAALLLASSRRDVPPEVRTVEPSECAGCRGLGRHRTDEGGWRKCLDCNGTGRDLYTPEPGPHTAGAREMVDRELQVIDAKAEPDAWLVGTISPNMTLTINNGDGLRAALAGVVAYLARHIAAPPVDLVLQLIAALAATIPSGPLAPRDHVPAMLAAIETLLRAMPWERPLSPQSLALHAGSRAAVETLAALPGCERATSRYIDEVIEVARVTIGNVEIRAQYSRPLTPEERDAAPSFGSMR